MTDIDRTVELVELLAAAEESARTSHARMVEVVGELERSKELAAILVDDLDWSCRCSESYKGRNLIAPNCEWCRYDYRTRATIKERRALLAELEGDNARNPDGTPFDGCVGAPKTSREDSP